MGILTVFVFAALGIWLWRRKEARKKKARKGVRQTAEGSLLQTIRNDPSYQEYSGKFSKLFGDSFDTLFGAAKKLHEVYKEEDAVQALNLLWAHYGKPRFDAIPPGVYRHCDLGHVVLDIHPRPQAHQPEGRLETFDFDFVVHPNTDQSRLQPGTYHLRIAAVASNARIVRRTVELVFSGQWHNDEATMFRDGVSLRLV